MGYYTEIRCDGCDQASPSFKLFRDQSQKSAARLGAWIYEHLHCTSEYFTGNHSDDPKEGGALTFTRIVEADNRWPINKDDKWHYPVSNIELDWNGEVEFTQ